MVSHRIRERVEARVVAVGCGLDDYDARQGERSRESLNPGMSGQELLEFLSMPINSVFERLEIGTTKSPRDFFLSYLTLLTVDLSRRWRAKHIGIHTVGELLEAGCHPHSPHCLPLWLARKIWVTDNILGESRRRDVKSYASKSSKCSEDPSVTCAPYT